MLTVQDSDIVTGFTTSSVGSLPSTVISVQLQKRKKLVCSTQYFNYFCSLRRNMQMITLIKRLYIALLPISSYLDTLKLSLSISKYSTPLESVLCLTANIKLLLGTLVIKV